MVKYARVIALEKCPTGIAGFDEVSSGGLPKGRPTLICGTAGCGKTMLAMEFLLRGAIQYKEPGVFVSFEETPKDLAQNFASLGYDLNDLVARKLIAMDHVYIERSEIEETGEYDLEGLFIRLAHAIDSIKAKRIVLDTIESLFSGLSNEGILRAELRRLFHWLKDRGITAVITGESGEKTLTRYGLEEYVADCVILLDFRVREQISTRRLRIIKYRGSSHGADEYPFLIEKTGISILPVTSLGLEHTVSNERISSGIPRLDSMLAGKGFYRGSTILISGTAGTGKTSFANKFVEAACRRGERCLYLAFEESADQIIRNMKSIGTDLAPWVKKGRLKFHASRPSLYGLEMHLVTIHNLIAEFKPQIVIVDPVSNLTAVGSSVEVKSVLTRLFDYLKGEPCHYASYGLGPFRRKPGEDERRDIIPHRHMGAAPRYRDQRRAEPRPVYPEVPRHGPLQPDPRGAAQRPRHRTCGRLPRCGRGAYRECPCGAGSEGEGRGKAIPNTRRTG